MAPQTLPFTGDPDADQLLEQEPLALLIGMLLDQQVPMEKAFRSPFDLKERLGGRLDASEIAATDPNELAALFSERPALHRFPGAMAARTQELCRQLVEHFDGEAENVWQRAPTGEELLANLKALPGFGEQKARIFVALLAKRLGVTPPGWEEAAGSYGRPGWYSVADVDGPDALARVREHKRAMKAEAKTKAAAKGGAKGGAEAGAGAESAEAKAGAQAEAKAGAAATGESPRTWDKAGDKAEAAGG